MLEIDVQGARQVRAREPAALVFCIVPPSLEVLEARLRGRGDPEEHVRRRLEVGRREIVEGSALADHVVVNDDLDRAVAEVRAWIEVARRTRATPSAPPGPPG